MKRFAIFCGLFLTVFVSQLIGAGNGSITLDHVDGLAPTGYPGIMTDEPVTFYLRLTNDIGHRIISISNGFRVYSPDGANWVRLSDSPSGSSSAGASGPC